MQCVADLIVEILVAQSKQALHHLFPSFGMIQVYGIGPEVDIMKQKLVRQPAVDILLSEFLFLPITQIDFRRIRYDEADRLIVLFVLDSKLPVIDEDRLEASARAVIRILLRIDADTRARPLDLRIQKAVMLAGQADGLLHGFEKIMVFRMGILREVKLDFRDTDQQLIPGDARRSAVPRRSQTLHLNISCDFHFDGIVILIHMDDVGTALSTGHRIEADVCPRTEADAE